MWLRYLGWRQGVRAQSAHEARSQGSVKWLQLLKIPGPSTKQPEPSDNSLPSSLRRHRGSSSAADEYNAVLPLGFQTTELNIRTTSI